MAQQDYLLEKKLHNISEYYHHDKVQSVGKFTNKQRKQLQHEIKIHFEKCGKAMLGKGSNFTKVTIWDDLLVFRGEGFLTDPEKYIVSIPAGIDFVNASRMQVVNQFSLDVVPYIEKKLGAKCIHTFADIKSEKDMWLFVMFFDQVLVDVK